MALIAVGVPVYFLMKWWRGRTAQAIAPAASDAGG
jgi:hypothetical protein